MYIRTRSAQVYLLLLLAITKITPPAAISVNPAMPIIVEAEMPPVWGSFSVSPSTLGAGDLSDSPSTLGLDGAGEDSVGGSVGGSVGVVVGGTVGGGVVGGGVSVVGVGLSCCSNVMIP